MSITKEQAATWFETMHPPGQAAREMYRMAAETLRAQVVVDDSLAQMDAFTDVDEYVSYLIGVIRNLETARGNLRAIIEELEDIHGDDLPLPYYRAYRKALRDLKAGIEKVGDNLKMYGMNNWKGMIAIIDMVLQDPEKLMYSQSLEGYEIPEPYLGKWEKYKAKVREKLKEDKP